MKTMFLSRTELEMLSRFWDLYVKKNTQSEIPDDPMLQSQMDEVLSEISDDTRDTFLSSLDQFEIQGEEFQVRIAPDDANLVSA